MRPDGWSKVFLWVFPTLLAINYAIALGVPGYPYARASVLLFGLFVVVRARARPARADVHGWSVYQVSLVLVLGLLIGWGCLSLLWSRAPLTTAAAVINVTVVLAAVVGFTVLLRRSPGLLRHYCWGWVASVYLIGLAAAAERATGLRVPVERLPGIDDALEINATTVSTFFANPNEMAVFLVVALPAVLHLATSARRPERLLARAAVPIILLGTLAASARLSGALVVLVLAAFIVMGRDWAQATKAIVLGWAAVLVVGALLALPGLLDKLSTLSESLSGSHSNSRTQLAVDGMDLLLSTGGLGVGAGAFEANAADPHLTYLGLWAFNPHNVYVEALAEYGIVVGGLIIAWILWLGWRWLTDKGTPQRAVVLPCWIALAGVGIQSSSSLNSLTFFMLPLTLVTLASQEPVQRPSSRQRGVDTTDNTARKGATPMDDFTRQVARSWILILIAALAGAALGVAYANVRSTPYVSESQVRITWEPAAGGTPDQGYDPLEELTKSYAAQASSANLIAPTLERLGIQESADALVKSKKLVAEPWGSGLVVIRAEASSREKAETLTRDAAEGLKEIIDGDRRYNGTPQATVVGPTATAARAAIPSWLLGAVGALMGALLSALVVALRTGLRPRVMSEDGLRALVADRAKVLGTVDAAASDAPANVAAGIALDRLRPPGAAAVAVVVADGPDSAAAPVLADALQQVGRSVAVLADSAQARPAVVSVGAAAADATGQPGSSQEPGPVVGLAHEIEARRVGHEWVLIGVPAARPDRVAAAIGYSADVAVIAVTAGRTRVATVEHLLAGIPEGVAAAAVLVTRESSRR